jgi:hypothetical protein
MVSEVHHLTTVAYPRVNASADAYRAATVKMLEQMKKVMSYHCDPSEISPDMIVIPAYLAERTRVAHEWLAKGLEAITASYPNNSRLKTMIPIPASIQTAMDIGNEWSNPSINCFMRPDIVFTPTLDGVAPKIIEVNIRFPIHMFIEAAAVWLAMEQSSFFDAERFELPPEYANILSSFDRAFPKGSSVWILKGRENCNESKALEAHWSSHERYVSVVNPKDLAVGSDGKLVNIRDEAAIGPDCILLELFQDEILVLSQEVLNAITTTKSYNPFLGTFIAHNKAIAAAVWDEEASAIAFRDWAEQDIQSLRNVVSETYVPGFLTIKQAKINFVEDKHLWVLKPSTSGRGQGVTLGCETAEETWAKLLIKANAGKDWVIQRYHPSISVEAYNHPSLFDNRAIVDLQKELLPLVATTFGSPHGEFLGLGPIRYGINSAVNQATGGAQTFPVIGKNRNHIKT